MSSISFSEVTKSFGKTVAVDDLTLEIADGEFLVLLGPSGCGKSTALRMLAGLETPTSGMISIDGEIVNDIDARHRDVAMVFQSYALYPHMTVAKNIESPLIGRRSERTTREARTQAVNRAADMLGLTDLLDRKPAQLSGGQRQRVALARAIVRKPAVFLMDEPLSNLDAKLRTETRAELVDLHAELGATFVYVTHDQVEAMTMATRIAVLVEGKLQQVAAPRELYDRPANVFVARFIGSPPMNIIAGRVRRDDRSFAVEVGGHAFDLDATWADLGDQDDNANDRAADRPEGTADDMTEGLAIDTAADTAEGLVEGTADEPAGELPKGAVDDLDDGRAVDVGVRPEDLDLAAAGMAATVIGSEWLGHEQIVTVEVDGTRLLLRDTDERFDASPRTQVYLTIKPGRLHLFDADSGERLSPPPSSAPTP